MAQSRKRSPRRTRSPGAGKRRTGRGKHGTPRKRPRGAGGSRAPEEKESPPPPHSRTRPRKTGKARRPSPGTGSGRRFKGFELTPFQEEAAAAIDAGHSVLLSAPTGAGKTLVAEYAIHKAIAEGKRAIYTAPIKALSNQKYRDFRDDPEIDVGLMTGDVTLNPGARLLIMTTEIFRNTIFEAPERFDDVAWLIFDEVHYLDDRDRGTVWEESLMFAPEDIRLICLSATIRNLDAFGAWIGSVRKQPIEIIHSEDRPVPLVHRLYHEAAGGYPLKHHPQVQRKVRTLLKRKGRHQHGRARSFSPHLASRHLLDEICEQGLLPVLYFCFSRRECEIKAERNANRRLLTPAERRRIARLFDRICDLFQLDLESDGELAFLRERALHGIGFHHAGMLPIHKEIVERLFTSGLLKLLFTTETFALGINMPARTVVFDSLRKFDGVDFDYMRTRDYMQMAGRAGRQGMDDEGLVYSILDNEDVQSAPVRRILEGEAEPIGSHFDLGYSSLLNLFGRLGRGLVAAYERSFHWYTLSRGAKGKKRAALKAREISRILRRLGVLVEAGYLDDEEGVLPRGRIASKINGYEIQLTELLFQGVLDDLEPEQLAGVFVSLVFQERRGSEMLAPIPGEDIETCEAVDRALRRFTTIEVGHGFPLTIKRAEWGLYPAALAWARGCDFEDLVHFTTTPPGDLVRSFRMAIQMLRQLQSAIDRTYPLHERLEVARVRMNRDVVDAKRQLELG